MRFNFIIKCLLVLLAAGLLLTARTYAQTYRVKSSAVGIRGSMVIGNDGGMNFHIHHDDKYDHVSTGNMGGSFFLMSRIADQFLLEFTIGAYARVFHDSYCHWENESHVYSAAPLLMGINYEILPVDVNVSIRPYLAFGPGAYLLSDIRVIEENDHDEAHIDSRIKFGIYGGGGFNFLFTENFRGNVDLKYHMIDMNPTLDRSGFEFSLGLIFTWGNYNQKSYSIPLPKNMLNKK